MAKAKKGSAANAKMYQHFAVVTVLLTAGIAVFADDDQQQDVQAQMLQQEQAARDAGKSVKKYGEPKLVNKFEKSRNRAGNGGGSFDESVPDFGVPMDNPGGGRDTGIIPGDLPQHRRMAVPSGYNAQYGISEEELAKLSDEERKKLLEQIKQGRYGADPDKRKEQIDRLMEMSRERSG